MSNSGVFDVNDIRYLMDYQQWSGVGTLELIQTQSISSDVDTVDFTNIKEDEYNVHFLTVNNLLPATDSQPTLLRFSNDGGSSFEAGTNYEYAFQNGGYGSGTFEEHKSTGTSGIYLTNNTSNATNETINLYCYIYNANDSSKYTFATYQGVWIFATGEMVMNFGSGVYDTAEVINAYQVLIGSGNITQGDISLYGISYS